MPGCVLPKRFFAQPALTVARELLGKYLVHVTPHGTTARMLTEVEAYDGPDDLACHASKGRTQRTEVMFAAGGVWYVYLIYGMYYMLNIVTGPRDYPAAILIRGVEGLDGPGKLTKQLGIDKVYNGKPASRVTGLYFEDRGVQPDPALIQVSPRIGIGYAGPHWSGVEYRYYIKGLARQHRMPG